MHILILDNDDAFRTLLSSLLQDSGHTVASARNVTELKSLCSSGECDLIFFDLSSTTEMISCIKEQKQDIPVVVMSQNPTIESTIAALRQGALDYIIKPITDRDELMKSLDRAYHAIEAASYQRVYLKRILQTFSELSFANEKIRELGYNDGVTELYFNHYFGDILAIELARSRRCTLDFSVVSVKLGFLQQYMSPEPNTEFRKQLEAVAGCLRQRIRRTDVLARTGVDEFMIILPETPKDGGLIVIESLRQGIAAIIPPETSGELPPFAIGLAAYPQDGMECQLLINKARQFS